VHENRAGAGKWQRISRKCHLENPVPYKVMNGQFDIFKKAGDNYVHCISPVPRSLSGNHAGFMDSTAHWVRDST
jgi:hypothetical protein